MEKIINDGNNVRLQRCSLTVAHFPFVNTVNLRIWQKCFLILHFPSCVSPRPRCNTSPQTAMPSPSEGYRVTGAPSHSEYGGITKTTSRKSTRKTGTRAAQLKLSGLNEISVRRLCEAARKVALLQITVRVWMHFRGWLITSSPPSPPAHTLSQQLSSLTYRTANCRTSDIQTRLLERIPSLSIPHFNISIEENAAEICW